MTPQTLLKHIDEGKLWSDAELASIPADVAQAYQTALQVRKLREARGEQPRGFKIGFTNRSIWERYQVFEPIWGTVWNTTLTGLVGQIWAVAGMASKPIKQRLAVAHVV